MIKIVGFENYEINEKGLIISKGKWVKSKNNSKAYKKEKVLKPSIYNGYKRVRLVKHNKAYNLYVHRLVAMAFIPNPENKPFVNHKDFNPLNCHVSNLEWCTQKENIHHSMRQNRYKIGENSYQTKLSKKDVLSIRKLYNTGKYTQVKLAEKYKIDQTTVSNIILIKTFKSIN